MHTSGGNRLLNQPLLQLSDLHDHDLGSSHTAFRYVSVIDLCLHT